MRLFATFILTLIVAFVSSIAAFAAETRVVPANRASAIFFYYTAGSDCHSGGKPKVHITREPEHGSVSTAWKPFRMGKEAGHCAGKPMHGTLVVYKPKPGYRGPDKVKVIFSGGVTGGYFVREREWIVNIQVK